MPKKKYIVSLTNDERAHLEQLLRSGRHAARTLTRARILLKADVNCPTGGCCDHQIATALDVGIATIERIRHRCVEEGIEAALQRRASSRIYQRLLDGQQEAQLIALACSEAPQGYGHWTLRLLAQTIVELGYVEGISHEAVRQTLKKTNSSLGSKPVG